jgi:hypothetical protein
MQGGSSSVALPPPYPHPDVDMDNDQGSSLVQGYLPSGSIPPNFPTPITSEDPIGSMQPPFQSVFRRHQKNIGGSSVRAVVATPSPTPAPGPKRVTRSSSRLALQEEIPETDDAVIFQSKRAQKRRAVPSESSNVS